MTSNKLNEKGISITGDPKDGVKNPVFCNQKRCSLKPGLTFLGAFMIAC